MKSTLFLLLTCLLSGAAYSQPLYFSSSSYGTGELTSSNWKYYIGESQSFDLLTKGRSDFDNFIMTNQEDFQINYYFGNLGMSLLIDRRGGLYLDAITYGTEGYFKRILGPVYEADGKPPKPFTTCKDILPFGIKLNSTVSEMEALVGGKIPLAVKPGAEFIEEYVVTDLPGYDRLEIRFEFIDKKLAALTVHTYNKNEWNRNKKKYQTDQKTFQKSMAENRFIWKRLNYEKLREFYNDVWAFGESYKVILAGKMTPESIKETFAADSLVLERNGKSELLRIIWCVNKLDDKEKMFYRLYHLTQLFFNKKYEGVLSNDKLLLNFQTSGSYSDKECFFFDPGDSAIYRTHNQHPVFHVYWSRDWNEVGLEIAGPSSIPNQNRFDKKFRDVCVPDDPLTLSLSKYAPKADINSFGIDSRYKPNPGDALFLALDEKISSELIKKYILPKTGNPKYEKGLSLATAGGLTIHYMKFGGADAVFSVTFDFTQYQGEAPFGLKPGTKVADLPVHIPGIIAEIRSDVNYRKEGILEYRYKITRDMELYLVFNYSKNIVTSLKISKGRTNNEILENQKFLIFPPMKEGLLGF